MSGPRHELRREPRCGLIARIDLRLPFVVGGIGVALAGLVIHKPILFLSKEA